MQPSFLYHDIADEKSQVTVPTINLYNSLASLSHPALQSHTMYMPIESPPTPAPSPGPFQQNLPNTTLTYPHLPPAPGHLSQREVQVRRQLLSNMIACCTPSELLFISASIAPLLKRDFLFCLPPELAIHILMYIEDPKTLARVAQVSKHWAGLVREESVWREMCIRYKFDDWNQDEPEALRARRWKRRKRDNSDELYANHETSSDSSLEWLAEKRKQMLRQRELTPLLTPLLNDEDINVSFRQYFKDSHISVTNWRQGGRLLRAHRQPISPPDEGVITSLALDSEWVVVGLANSKIHVFSARTGVLARTLIGHELGVWSVFLVSSGGWMSKPATREKPTQNGKPTNQESHEIPEGLDVPLLDFSPASSSKSKASDKRRRASQDPSSMRGLRAGFSELGVRQPLDYFLSSPLRGALGLEDLDQDDDVFDEDAEESGQDNEGPELWPGRRSDMCCASQGWGQPNSLVVSGGCDKVLRVWDIMSGQCIYVLAGHTSTIRCMRVLHNRPIAVTGSRDSTLRVWDVQRGRGLRVLAGHEDSVRCLDVCGNRVVSASYDTTCRLWDIDTGECLHVLRGHFHQLYSVAFDGERIASGGLDTTVRVWDARTGQCIALLQGHTALVCQLQLSSNILATGGSDGRVITFSLETFKVLHRIAAHDSSVTSLQFDKQFLVTGGNDGRVRLFETETGSYIRELSDASEIVWKVAYVRDTCAVMCKRAGKTVMEIWSLSARNGR